MFETLIKKYGKLKLRKFLLELHPHLNKGQQKRNVKYIRATKFGATPEQMAANDVAHKGWDSNPNIVPQNLGDSLNTIDFESAFIKGKTGPSTKNFVNRSDIITWKNNVLKPHAFQINYKKPGVSNLIQLILTVLLAEYTDNVEIQNIKETRFMRYMNNATCFEMPGINIFGSFDEKTYRTVFDEIPPDTDKQKMVKAELLMLLMRVFDMLHDFYDPDGRTGDIGKYMETFLKALVPVANMGAPYYIVFYSFADQTYKNIQFPFYQGTQDNPLSLDPILQFPGACIEFIKQIQKNENTASRGEKRYNEELTQTWSDQLFHFNMVTVARNKFIAKRNLQHFLYNTDKQHVVLNDVANHYTKLMDLYHNIHIAPSTFTDANSTGGSKPITVGDLVEVQLPDEEKIYYKLGGGLNTNRFIQGDARSKGAVRGRAVSDLYDITARQLLPDFLSNVDKWKKDTEDGPQKSRVLTYNDLDKEGKASKLSVVSCYYDTIIHFEKNKPSMKPESYKMHLRFVDSNNETHIQAITGFETPIVHDSTEVTNQFLPIIVELGWTVVEIIPNTKERNLRQEFEQKKKEEGRIPALEWLRVEHGIDINKKDGDGRILKTVGGKIKTLTDEDLKKIFKERAELAGGLLFEGAVFLCRTPDGRGRIFIVDASLQFPGVDALHKICRKIENNMDYPNTLKLNYYAQLTTIKFYGDSSQAQTPLRHLYTAGYSQEDMNKSVLLTQGDTTSTLVCALQNRLLPLVYDNFRKCNVLGGHPENAGYGGLFTLPALDIVPQPDSPGLQSEQLPPPVPMSDSPTKPNLPPGWVIDEVGDYVYEKKAYTKPAVLGGWEYITSTKGRPYWRYYAVVGKDYKHYIPESVPPDVIDHKDLQITPLRGVGEVNSDPRRESGETPDSKRPKFGSSFFRAAESEKINWKKPLTLDVSRLVKMSEDGHVQFLRGIRETSLFKQLGITTEYGRNETRQRIIKTPTLNTVVLSDRQSSRVSSLDNTEAKSGPKTEGVKAVKKEDEERTATGTTGNESSKFGKRQWYVDRSRNNKLCRKQCKGSNPSWVTPQYYKKITGKSFWKLPVAKK